MAPKPRSSTVVAANGLPDGPKATILDRGHREPHYPQSWLTVTRVAHPRRRRERRARELHRGCQRTVRSNRLKSTAEYSYVRVSCEVQSHIGPLIRNAWKSHRTRDALQVLSTRTRKLCGLPGRRDPKCTYSTTAASNSLTWYCCHLAVSRILREGSAAG